MKLIVGLGNPGKKYEHTRHNAGFLAIDAFLQGKETISCASKFKSTICEMHFMVHTDKPSSAKASAGRHESGERINTNMAKVFLIKPQTFMNDSGEAVREIIDFYKVDPEKDLLVIHDEVDLKFGFYKLAFDSRPAGHNGVKSIVEHLDTQKFHRLRIGVETRLSRHESPTDQFVLHNFTNEQLAHLHSEVFPKINEEIENFISESK